MENSPPNQLSADTENSSRPSSVGSGARVVLVYVLHSADMYGTERIALATAQGLGPAFRIIFLGPLGPAIYEARKLGFETREFQTILQLVKLLWKLLGEFDSITFVSTLARYSRLCMLVNRFRHKRVHKIQMIHGGGNEKEDYAGLSRFNALDVTFVAVSDYGRQRLIHHGVRADRIAVVGNFLTRQQLESMPRRPRYEKDGIRTIVLVSRVDPPKRVDLLLDALDRCGDKMRDISFRILGWGPDLDRLRDRAARTHPNVNFLGYVDNVPEELAGADLLLHTCPVETFGVAVLEAMAVNLPALVPDAGGTGILINDGETGFTFRADDADHLAARLVELKDASAELLNRIARDAQISSQTRYSENASIQKYRELFTPRGE